jgi:uncharacterized protein (UPF0264 family)
MPQLLVSIRSINEAEAALAGGADLIDVKEPRKGSLGRASNTTIEDVCEQVGRRRPVSAALGELLETSAPLPRCGLAYVKWGLAGCLQLPDWRERLIKTMAEMQRALPGCQGVVVAYADWHLAGAPTPADVCALACRVKCGAFLVDTWAKTGRTLLDWLSPDEIGRFCCLCREAGVRVALAGSLHLQHIRLLRAVQPTWFAVRGAVCTRGRRTHSIDVNRVRRLSEFVKALTPVSMPAN